MKIRGMMNAGLVLLAGMAAGCGNDDDEIIGVVPGVDTGTLVQGWTIEGTKDITKCAQYNADRMRVVIFDEDGSVDATEFAPCRAFNATLELRPSRYTGAATFVNANGDPVSRTMQLAPFTIADEQTTTVTLDFPAEAMTP